MRAAPEPPRRGVPDAEPANAKRRELVCARANPQPGPARSRGELEAGHATWYPGAALLDLSPTRAAILRA